MSVTLQNAAELFQVDIPARHNGDDRPGARMTGQGGGERQGPGAFGNHP